MTLQPDLLILIHAINNAIQASRQAGRVVLLFLLLLLLLLLFLLWL